MRSTKKSPKDPNDELYDKARKHVVLGTTKMMKAGATAAEVEYAVAAGVEAAGFTSVCVVINIKEKT